MRTYQKYIKDASFFPLSLFENIELNTMCKVARRLDNRDAIPATSSNFSIRTSKNSFLVTKSGLHKRELNPSHFIRTDFYGQPLHPQAPKPSDETLLHAVIYRNFESSRAILHCHAPELEFFTLNKTEKIFLPSENPLKKNYGFFKIQGHELLKAIGYKSHTEDFYLPVIQNNQDMTLLSNEVETLFFKASTPSPICAFVLESHGIYCFGNSVAQAELRLEAILHLAKTLK